MAKQVVLIDLLEQIAAGAQTQAFREGLAVLAHREHQNRQAGMGLMDLSHGLAAVHARHVHVKQNNVRIKLFDKLDAFQTVAGLADHLEVRLPLKKGLDTAAKQRVVIDQNNADALSHFFQSRERLRLKCGKAGLLGKFGVEQFLNSLSIVPTSPAAFCLRNACLPTPEKTKGSPKAAFRRRIKVPIRPERRLRLQPEPEPGRDAAGRELRSSLQADGPAEHWRGSSGRRGWRGGTDRPWPGRRRS